MHRFFVSVLAFTAFVPLVSHAQTFATLANQVLSVVNALVPLVIGLTVVVILWKTVSSFIIHNEDSKNIESGKLVLLWGIIILVVMLSVWGILTLLTRTFFA